MVRPFFTPAAINDIAQIWDYTAENWGQDQAEYYLTILRDNCQNIADKQKNGRAIDVRQGYYKYRSGKHFIYYRWQNTQLHIVRILHEAMDVDWHL